MVKMLRSFVIFVTFADTPSCLAVKDPFRDGGIRGCEAGSLAKLYRIPPLRHVLDLLTLVN